MLCFPSHSTLSSAWVQDLLGLSREQREQLLAHRHIKLVSLARLVQERRELQLKLQVSVQRTPPASLIWHPCRRKVSALPIGRRVAICAFCIWCNPVCAAALLLIQGWQPIA